MGMTAKSIEPPAQSLLTRDELTPGVLYKSTRTTAYLYVLEDQHTEYAGFVTHLLYFAHNKLGEGFGVMHKLTGREFYVANSGSFVNFENE